MGRESNTEASTLTGEHEHDDMGGLVRDHHMMGRRSMLGLLGGIGAAGALAACGGEAVVKLASSATTAAPSGSTATTIAGAAATTSTLAADSAAVDASPGSPIPSETGGPFPADGTNGPNVLSDGAVVRRDITTSFGDYSGTATGTPVAINLTVVDASTGSPIEGAAV